MSSAKLQELLGEARALNAATHLSGVLLYGYGDGDFMQCFEGTLSTARSDCQVVLDKFRVNESGGMSLLLEFWSRRAHSVRSCVGA